MEKWFGNKKEIAAVRTICRYVGGVVVESVSGVS